jgi:carbamoyl-phosphate synthase large subunit
MPCSAPRCARPARSWASTGLRAWPSPSRSSPPATACPTSGTVFFSLADRDKPQGAEAARGFVELGFQIAATSGTADHFEAAGIPVATRVAKLSHGSDEVAGATAVDLLDAGKVDLVVNCPRGRGPRADGDYIRSAAATNRVPLLTTASAALAAAEGMRDRAAHAGRVMSLQEYHAT